MTINKLKFIFMALGALFACGQLQAGQDVETHAEAYRKAGSQIMDMINSNHLDQPQIDALVLEMTRHAVPLANAYIDKYPDGKKLIEIIIGQAAKLDGGKVTGLGMMAEQTLETIEHQWHDMDFAQSRDIGLDMDDEDNEHFTAPLDVVLHPLATLAASREDGEGRRNEMKAELQEGLEQLEILLSRL